MKLMGGDRTQLMLLTLVLGLLNGCASVMGVGKSEYSCPGGIEGVRCMSARQVYQATHSSDTVKSTGGPDADKVQDGKKTVLHQYSRVAVPRIGQPVPIRTQAQVMRIWMAPWEDEEGDLHADGYLYTEIQGRRWNLGENFTAPGSTLTPLSSPNSAIVP